MRSSIWKRSWILLLGLACLNTLCLNALPRLGAEESVLSGLEKAKQELTQAKYLLRYKYQTSETIRYEIEQLVTIDTTIAGNHQKTQLRTQSERSFAVEGVDPNGDMRFSHTINRVNMWSEVGGRAPVHENDARSAVGGFPPGLPQSLQGGENRLFPGGRRGQVDHDVSVLRQGRLEPRAFGFDAGDFAKIVVEPGLQTARQFLKQRRVESPGTGGRQPRGRDQPFDPVHPAGVPQIGAPGEPGQDQAVRQGFHPGNRVIVVFPDNGEVLQPLGGV